jgi:hypothetical protein
MTAESRQHLRRPLPMSRESGGAVSFPEPASECGGAAPPSTATKLVTRRAAAARGRMVPSLPRTALVTERHEPRGWRCMACHPPDHLAPDQVDVVG